MVAVFMGDEHSVNRAISVTDMLKSLEDLSCGQSTVNKDACTPISDIRGVAARTGPECRDRKIVLEQGMHRGSESGEGGVKAGDHSIRARNVFG
jgi:hypothetical protein